MEKLYNIDKRKPLVWFVFVVNDDLQIAMIAVVTNVAIEVSLIHVIYNAAKIHCKLINYRLESV